MATVDDVEVANASFPNVRQDLNDILEAITTNFSADTEPTTTYPNQFWYETDTNLLYIRNEADDAWITLASINQTTGEWEPRTAVIQAIDSAGIALKTDDGTTRFSISDAGVVSFENYAFPSADGTAGQVLSTDGSGTLTFEDAGAGDKIEEGNSSVEVVDTGTGHVAITTDGSERVRVTGGGNVGIGTTSPSAVLHLQKAVNVGDVGLIIDNTGTSNNTCSLYLNKSQGSQRDWRLTNDGGAFFAIGAGTDESSFTDYMTIDNVGNFKFDSGYGSVATAYGCRAWINFEGNATPVSVRDSANVSSLTDNAVANYTINFSSAMPDANYAAVVGGRADGNVSIASGGVMSTTQVEIETYSNSGSTQELSHVCVAIIR